MDFYPIKEFDPLKDLLVSLPNKVQRHFRSHHIYWSAIATEENFIAVATHSGVVFLCDRLARQLRKLECEVSSLFLQ